MIVILDKKLELVFIALHIQAQQMDIANSEDLMTMVASIEELKQAVKDTLDSKTEAVEAIAKFAAADIFSTMLKAGIQGVLNFSPTELKDSSGKCLVNNVNIAIMIENLFFYANNSMELATSSRMMDEHNLPTL